MENLAIVYKGERFRDAKITLAFGITGRIKNKHLLFEQGVETPKRGVGIVVCKVKVKITDGAYPALARKRYSITKWKHTEVDCLDFITDSQTKAKIRNITFREDEKKYICPAAVIIFAVLVMIVTFIFLGRGDLI